MTDARTKEAIRYLGYGRHAVDEQTLALIDVPSGSSIRLRRQNPSIAFLTVKLQEKTR